MSGSDLVANNRPMTQCPGELDTKVNITADDIANDINVLGGVIDDLYSPSAARMIYVNIVAQDLYILERRSSSRASNSLPRPRACVGVLAIIVEYIIPDRDILDVIHYRAVRLLVLAHIVKLAEGIVLDVNIFSRCNPDAITGILLQDATTNSDPVAWPRIRPSE